jgi:hypothetical protein
MVAGTGCNAVHESLVVLLAEFGLVELAGRPLALRVTAEQHLTVPGLVVAGDGFPLS